MMAFMSSKKGTQAAVKKMPHQKSNEGPLWNHWGSYLANRREEKNRKGQLTTTTVAGFLPSSDVRPHRKRTNQN